MVASRTAVALLGIGAAAIAVLATTGCGDDDRASPPRDGSSQSGGATGVHTLAGALAYELVPYGAADDGGLDYARTIQKKIRGASLQLMSADDGAMLAESTSGDDGSYSFTYEGPTLVKLWIFSETSEPRVTVQDNTAGGAVYVLESEVVDTAVTSRLDVLAATGWGGQGYVGARAAAPFAILDAIYEAEHRFLREVTPPPSFPPLVANWSVNNRPEAGDVAAGRIGTSNWDGEALFLLGQEDVDTDEFDTHVLVHEWGHYYEDMLGRSDSPGGSHGFGEVLDPRVAFSEGWGDAVSAMILDPDVRYTDSSGRRQANGFTNDLERNDTRLGAKPGWFSEASVQAILFDLYDPANEPFDRVSVGLPGVHAAMTGAMKATNAMTTAFSFVAALKAANAAQADAIDALVIEQGADRRFGVDPISDAWATGETHGGGVAGSLPVYVRGAIGRSYTLGMTGGADFNTLAQNRFVRFAGDGRDVTVASTAAADVDLFIYNKGALMAASTGTTGDEAVHLSTSVGETYVINVQGYNSASEDYAVSVRISR